MYSDIMYWLPPSIFALSLVGASVSLFTAYGLVLMHFGDINYTFKGVKVIAGVCIVTLLGSLVWMGIEIATGKV